MLTLPGPQELLKFGRFGLVGTATAGIYFGVLYLSLEVLGAPYIVGVTCAYVLSVIFQFLANRRFTFKSQSVAASRQVPRYLALLAINYLITVFIVRTAVEGFGLTPYLGVLASVPVIMVVGYLVSKHWVFKEGFC